MRPFADDDDTDRDVQPDLGSPTGGAVAEDDVELADDPTLAPPDEDEAGRQKRENVRVEVQLPLTIKMLGREIHTRTRDMSATGVGFSTRLPIAIEHEGEVSIEFGDWTFTKQVVVRFVRPILAGYTVGAQFDALTEDERERLVKQVFDVQRAQLRAGRRASKG